MLRPCACAGPAADHGGVGYAARVRCVTRCLLRGGVPLAAAAPRSWAVARPRPLRCARARRPVSVRSEAGDSEEMGLLPPPEVKVWSRKALRRIEREGPREADLRDEVGRIVKECLPPARDAAAPDWRSLRRLSFCDFMAALRDGSATEVELWSDRDPNVYWPPPPFHVFSLQQPFNPLFRPYVNPSNKQQVFAGKRVLVKLSDGSRAFTEFTLPEMERVATSALLSSEGAVPYSFHQPPGRDGYSQLEMGLIAIGGGIFIFLSIYLGIVRKAGIPTDTIQAMEFGQSKAKSRKEGRTGVTFKDVAGLETVLEELQEVVAFLKDPGRFNTVGARPPRGLLLEGGPGTGKTLVAKAIAGEAGVPFYSMSGSEFVEVIVGVGAARVRDLFKRARVNAPCIIFVDEIDALGGRRAPSSMRGNEEREQTLNQLLTEMDGFTADTGVIFVGATNRADLLDPALLRPGRFDRRVTVRKPDASARAAALRIHTRNGVPLEAGLDLDTLAATLVGFSGAEVANCVNEAALAAVRRGATEVGAVDFAAAQDRVLLGVVRSSKGLCQADARRIAVHEAGHALVASTLHVLGGPRTLLTPIERVSLQARGEEWSRTVWLRDDEGAAALPTRTALVARVRVLLAGAAAEAALLSDAPGMGASTLSAEDLQDASTLARRAVADYGLAGSLTTFAWPTAFAGVMPSRLASDGRAIRNPAGHPASGPQLARGEQAVRSLLDDAWQANLALLAARRAALDALAEALLERETLSGAEVLEVLERHPPAPGDEHRGLAAELAPAALAG